VNIGPEEQQIEISERPRQNVDREVGERHQQRREEQQANPGGDGREPERRAQHAGLPGGERAALARCCERPAGQQPEGQEPRQGVGPGDVGDGRRRAQDARAVEVLRPVGRIDHPRRGLERALDGVGIGHAVAHEHRCRTGDVRRRHGRPAEGRVPLALALATVADRLLDDIDAGGGDIDLRTARRERRDLVLEVAGAHADDAL
jgi:hypothetical protein